MRASEYGANEEHQLTMSQTPRIFDRDLLTKRRCRALVNHGHEGDFLLSHCVEDMLDRLSLVTREFPNIVELVGHTGLLAKHLSKREGTEHIIRLEHDARFLASEPHAVVATEEALPLKPQSIDLVVSPLALHWANDLPGALIQIHQSLKPDGLFLGCLLGNESLKELRTVLLQADSEISEGVSPRVAPFPELKDMGALLQRAGFALPVADQDSVTVRYDSMFALMQDLRKMGATNILHDRSRSFTRRDILLRAAELYQQQFSDPDGRIRATFHILNVSGWAPHESQQKPMKPGSAKAHISQFLPDKSEKR